MIFVTAFYAPSARAQYASGPVSAATGGAGRAAVDPNESALLNPASIGFLHDYYSSFQYSVSDQPGYLDYNGYGLLLADGSKTNLLPGAISYQHRITDLASGLRLTEQDIQAGISFHISILSVGISAHRLITQTWPANYTQDNATLGFLISPMSWLGLAAVAYDILPTSAATPDIVRLSPTYALAGHVLIDEIFRLRLDLVHPDTNNPGLRNNVMAGMETYFRPDIGFRLGCQWLETKDQTNLTAGVGFHGPKLSLDYSFATNVRSVNAFTHMIDLWVPL